MTVGQTLHRDKVSVWNNPGIASDMAAALSPVATIQSLVAEHYAIPLRLMTNRELVRPAPQARQVAMFLAREKTPHSLPAIGRCFGGRDHSTVMHACRQVERLIGEDRAFAADVRELEGRL